MKMKLAQVKSQFLSCLKAIHRTDHRLEAVVALALDSGVTPATLTEWGVEGGYSKNWVQSTIGRVLIARGHRRHQVGAGAGPKPPPQAYSLANDALDRFHEKAPKLLLAASRIAAKKLRAMRTVEQEQAKLAA